VSLPQHIPHPRARRFAVGDVHGCYHTLEKLLEAISFTKEDQLFLLGDMINRGKRTKDVLDFLVHHIDGGYEMYPLRGNHEHHVHALIEQNHVISKQSLISLGLAFLFDKRGTIIPRYKTFFARLPFYIELNNSYLVHAGFNFKREPLLDYESMLSIRKMNINESILGGKRLIHGHTPVGLSEIEKAVHAGCVEINLDNGCALGNKFPGLGHLVCLNVDNLELFYLKNID